MNTKNLLLRTTDHSPLENLEELLTGEQVDQNTINIYEDFAALSSSSYIEQYDEDIEFDDTIRNCCSYLGKTYQYISGEAGLVVLPTDDEDVWIEVFPTLFAHKKNSDTILAEGTEFEVSAEEIKNFIEAGETTSTDLTISEKTNASLKVNSSTGSDVVLTGATSREAGLLTSSDKVKLNNTSGKNTGDQSLAELGGEPSANKVTSFAVIDNDKFPTVEATENRISEKIAEVVDSAPAILDTLNELAEALGNDENFSTTMTALIATKENSSNKVTTFEGNETSTTKFPVVKAIIDFFTVTKIKEILGITILSGDNTGDQDISGFVPYTGASESLVMPLGTNIVLENVTPNQISYIDSSNNLLSLSTSTYPNLTELSYVKGVTSGMQSQIDTKTNKLIVENAQIGTSYTLVLTDTDKLLSTSNASANTVTIPPNADVAFSVGTQIVGVQLGAGQTSLVAGSGVTILSSGGKLKCTGQYSGYTLIKQATDTWLLMGDIAL